MIFLNTEGLHSLEYTRGCVGIIYKFGIDSEIHIVLPQAVSSYISNIRKLSFVTFSNTYRNRQVGRCSNRWNEWINLNERFKCNSQFTQIKIKQS